MKKTYFYSEKQKSITNSIERNAGRIPTVNIAPNGELYTEVISIDGEHKSNFEDAKVVYVSTGHKLDEFSLKHFGKRFAK